MKIQAISLAAVGSMVNDILQFDYDTKSNGFVWLKEESCRDLLSFVEQFNVAQKSLANQIEAIKANKETIDQEIKREKDALIASWEKLPKQEQQAAHKTITEQFNKIDLDSKKDKDELVSNLKKINEKEYELPEINIELIIPAKKTKSNDPLVPAKIMHALEFLKASFKESKTIEAAE